jgi:hypothetical protein
MKKLAILIFLLLIKLSVFSQKSGSKNTLGSSADKNWGVGLRLGDPLGLTLKKYFGNNNAFEFNLGRTFLWGYRHDKYYKFKYRKDPYYLSPYYYNYSAVSFQFHYLKHRDISALTGLQLYFGGGPQLRVYKYSYSYYDRGGRFYDDTDSQVGIGVDGVFGAEYTFADFPITVFTDVNLYLEFAQNPLWLTLQGGLGGRFNF